MTLDRARECALCTVHSSTELSFARQFLVEATEPKRAPCARAQVTPSLPASLFNSVPERPTPIEGHALEAQTIDADVTAPGIM